MDDKYPIPNRNEHIRTAQHTLVSFTDMTAYDAIVELHKYLGFACIRAVLLDIEAKDPHSHIAEVLASKPLPTRKMIDEEYDKMRDEMAKAVGRILSKGDE